MAKSVSKNGFTYSVKARQECGSFTMYVAKKAFDVKLCVVDINTLYLDPDNPRLLDIEDVDPKLTQKGQKSIAESLTTKSLAGAAKRLEASLDYHGGQNEEIWVQSRNGKAIVVEGNRRLTLAKKLGWKTLYCIVLPDEMGADYVSQLIARRHLGEAERWTSAVRSEIAHKFLMGEIGGVEGDTLDERLANIVKLMQFSSVKDAKKFIHSYVWFKKSGLSSEDWSKFHHLYVPRMVAFFGYDENHIQDGTAPFKDELRKAPKNTGMSVREIDKLILEASGKKSIKTGFEWFVDLIKEDQITDCRQSDGIIAPAISSAGEPYAFKLFQLLQKPSNKTLQKTDGSGTLDKNAPAQIAWNFFKEAKQDNHLNIQITKIREMITDVITTSKIRGYQKPTSDNKILRFNIGELKKNLEKFLQVTVNAENEDEDEAAA